MGTVHFVKTDYIANKIDALFTTERQRLSTLLPNADIQHVCGTSVPGSISKGDLDINIRVRANEFPEVTKILTGLYQINQPDNWTPAFASFKDESRDLGIQLTVIGSIDDYFVAQRDYLREHPEKVSELNAIKEKFEGKNMHEYRKEKGKFFDRLNASSDSKTLS